MRPLRRCWIFTALLAIGCANRGATPSDAGSGSGGSKGGSGGAASGGVTGSGGVATRGGSSSGVATGTGVHEPADAGRAGATSAAGSVTRLPVGDRRVHPVVVEPRAPGRAP